MPFFSNGFPPALRPIMEGALERDLARTASEFSADGDVIEVSVALFDGERRLTLRPTDDVVGVLREMIDCDEDEVLVVFFGSDEIQEGTALELGLEDGARLGASVIKAVLVIEEADCTDADLLAVLQETAFPPPPSSLTTSVCCRRTVMSERWT